MTFPNTAQEQLFSIPKIPICGGGYIIKGCFCVWACCILWHADVFHNNKRLSNLLLWCHMTTTSIWILFCNILKTFVALSHGSVDAEDQEEWVFFPSVTTFTLGLPLPAHSFALNWLSHLSLSRLPLHCGGSPLNQGPITLPLEYRPFSLTQAAQREASTHESHFNQIKLSPDTLPQKHSRQHPPSEERIEQHPGRANLKMENVNSVKYVKINDIQVRQQASGQEILMQSEKLLLGSMGAGIQYLSFYLHH